MGYIVAAAVLTAGIIAVLVIAHLKRNDPKWQRSAPSIRALLYGQLALIALLLVARVLIPN